MAADYGFRSPSDLPDTLPVFPLDGALVLPRAQLPLNIFEPRYLAMVDSALARPDRLIGMIQTVGDHLGTQAHHLGIQGVAVEAAGGAPDNPALADVGCAGKIVSFSETGDGRYLISLAGICRFRVEQELTADTPYRVVAPDWAKFAALDFQPPSDAPFDREAFEAVLKQFFSARDLAADWESIRQAPLEPLVNQLAIGCPFAPPEKQALLEADTVQARLDVLITLMRMEAAASGSVDPGAMQ